MSCISIKSILVLLQYTPSYTVLNSTVFPNWKLTLEVSDVNLIIRLAFGAGGQVVLIWNDLFEMSTKDRHAKDGGTGCDMSDPTRDDGTMFLFGFLFVYDGTMCCDL